MFGELKDEVAILSSAGIGGGAGELYSWRRAFSGSILTERRAGK
jgi:hypothetical protein